MDYDKLPYGWTFTKYNKHYICMCGFTAKDVSEVENHIEENVDGDFYKCGMRGISRSEIECICGLKFTHTDPIKLRDLGSYHYFRQYGDEDISGSIPICMKVAKHYCEKCDIKFIGIGDLKRHYDTRKHEEFGRVILDLECKICNVKYLSQKQIQTHLDTKKHKQIVANGKIELECKTCNIKCPSQKQMLTHLETKKHKKGLVDLVIH